MREISYYSQCECGQIVQGMGELDEVDGTLYGLDCPACGLEFCVLGWADEEEGEE